MSARPGDWHLLQQGGDPLPGDEYEVAAQSRHYNSVAETISRQITQLRRISNGDAQGKYVEGLTKTTNDIADELTKVKNRFETVAEQLTKWEPVLSEGRRVSGQLLTHAGNAHHTMHLNQSTGALPVTATVAEVTADQHRQTRYNNAASDLSGYVSQLNSELSRVKGVAKGVADKIDSAAHDQVKDSWWDKHVRKWVHDHAHLIEIIVRIIEIVAIVVAVIALVVLTGGLGIGALAGVAAALSGVAGALEVGGAVLAGTLLAAHALEMDAGVNGVGWGTIALDALSLVTFGAGRLLGAAGKGAEGLGNVARSAAATRAEAGLATNIKNALNISSETNPLRIWAAAQRSTAISEALANVNRAIERPASLGVKILAGDSELAQTLASMRAMENFPEVVGSASKFLHIAEFHVAVNVVDHLHLSYDTFNWFHGRGGEE